jgi:hypothetical protein
MFMSRNGKIAHLPRNVRNEINERLENGEEGQVLLDWLNGLPIVDNILKQNFDGAPITKQNLSEWRQGGFREWKVRQELIDQACQTCDSADDLDEYVDMPLLAGKLAALLAARYASLLNNWHGQLDPQFHEMVHLLRGLNRDIALLQKTMYQADKQKREHEKAIDDEEKRDLEEEKKRETAPIWARLESEAMAAQFGDGDQARMIADYLSAVKYDLPPPKSMVEHKLKMDRLKEEQAKATSARPTPGQPASGKSSKPESKSNPVQVSPTSPKSGPVAPSQSESNQDQADSSTANPEREESMK